MELGEADDIFFGRENSKQREALSESSPMATSHATSSISRRSPSRCSGSFTRNFTWR
jgi:hypothetical protein